MYLYFSMLCVCVREAGEGEGSELFSVACICRCCCCRYFSQPFSLPLYKRSQLNANHIGAHSTFLYTLLHFFFSYFSSGDGGHIARFLYCKLLRLRETLVIIKKEEEKKFICDAIKRKYIHTLEKKKNKIKEKKISRAESRKQH